jgi:hypothetical protein
VSSRNSSTPGYISKANGYEVDELRDLPITKTDILLTHSYHWADTSSIVIERKRCDERLASKGESASPWQGETFFNLHIPNSILRLTAVQLLGLIILC